MVTAPAHPPRSAPAAPPAGPRPALRVGLFGCALDTGNLGVAALGIGSVNGLHRAAGDLRATLFDYGRGVRAARLPLADGDADATLVGFTYSRRLHRADNLRQALPAAALGLAGLHPMLRRLRALHAVMDISGGDSFADIYGMWRYRSVAAPKVLALRLGVPLVLLPQTYGPYAGAEARASAAAILRGAAQVWARDARSLEVARQLLADDFDPARHRAGVDVAFGLPARRPADAALADRVESFRDRGPLVGLNVSGLLYNQPGEDLRRFGFREPYKPMVDDLLRRLLAVDGLRLLLVEHVAPGKPIPDCDAAALRTIVAAMPPEQRGRTLVVPASLGATGVKWAVGRCDWFCGTRMHACIAGLSQGVPTASIAYSDKTLGVFETAGVGECVIDPRAAGAAEVVARAMDRFHDRERARAALAARLPEVRRTLDEQFRAIVEGVRACA